MPSIERAHSAIALSPIEAIGSRLQAGTVFFHEDEIVDVSEREGLVEAPHEVIGAAVEGDLDALSTLWEVYNNRIVNYCRRRVFFEDAEDCSQEAWFRALGAIDRYQYTGALFYLGYTKLQEMFVMIITIELDNRGKSFETAQT